MYQRFLFGLFFTIQSGLISSQTTFISWYQYDNSYCKLSSEGIWFAVVEGRCYQVDTDEASIITSNSTSITETQYKSGAPMNGCTTVDESFVYKGAPKECIDFSNVNSSFAYQESSSLVLPTESGPTMVVNTYTTPGACTNDDVGKASYVATQVFFNSTEEICASAMRQGIYCKGGDLYMKQYSLPDCEGTVLSDNEIDEDEWCDDLVQIDELMAYGYNYIECKGEDGAGSEELSDGVIAGIAVGSVVGAGLIGGGVYMAVQAKAAAMPAMASTVQI